ncbi:hypothetical protein TWF281_007532 [Arthrobotrys megalospora]
MSLTANDTDAITFGDDIETEGDFMAQHDDGEMYVRITDLQKLARQISRAFSEEEQALRISTTNQDIDILRRSLALIDAKNEESFSAQCDQVVETYKYRMTILEENSYHVPPEAILTDRDIEDTKEKIRSALRLSGTLSNTINRDLVKIRKHAHGALSQYRLYGDQLWPVLNIGSYTMQQDTRFMTEILLGRYLEARMGVYMFNMFKHSFKQLLIQRMKLKQLWTEIRTAEKEWSGCVMEDSDILDGLAIEWLEI